MTRKQNTLPKRVHDTKEWISDIVGILCITATIGAISLLRMLQHVS